MATGTSLSRVFPLGSRLNERGRLEVGGCDVVELASEFGTPAYVVAEDDLRTRARAFIQAGREAGHADLHVVFASKAFPCVAVLRLFADEGLWCDVASGGELHLALTAGFPPERIVLHGNAKSEAELRMALRAGVGLIVIDNFDEIERLARLLAEEPTAGEAPQAVLVRVTPDVRGETHEKISTGQADSKFGFAIGEAPRPSPACAPSRACRSQGVHAHIGSQLLDLEPFRALAAELAALGDFPVWDFGGGLGVQYTEHQAAAPSVEEYVGAIVDAAREHGIGTGAAPADRARPLAQRQRVRHALHGRERQAERLALGGGRRRHVRQPAPDALRRPLRGSRRRPLRRRDAVRGRRQALRVRRRDRARRAARRPAPGRRARDPGDRRLRLLDGEQLQRRAPAAGHLLLRRRRARRSSDARPSTI